MAIRVFRLEDVLWRIENTLNALTAGTNRDEKMLFAGDQPAQMTVSAASTGAKKTGMVTNGVNWDDATNALYGKCTWH